MSAHWDLGKEKDLRMGTMYNMAQQGLLRSGELLSGITTDDIIRTGEGSNFDLELERANAAEGEKLEICSLCGTI
jgi:hypothetical protein